MSARILIVEGRFYEHISNALLDGATAALDAAGARFERISVPGAFEIPAAIAFAARVGEEEARAYDGYIALGCVIRGETYHFELVANESARGIMHLALTGHLCIGNGILTVENEEQALARAARDQLDKGGDAARACLALISLRARLGDRS
ncbi:MAG: 6,7-dimethyl-8-ribityllumazine synthase [Alphaproteobacteria bacterium]|nr:6,7-dimethyl-8-ribityllumazine synthase [Alphaproteobacteria bacterium]MBV9061865.1 6,7-dimethyl-8-ribityllumazine synthase [Alphaproteobacteria bacterium]MBV9911756.1 6,7-dimethyl-8-ribityllumazine synthase [Nevskiaceae bacterium]